VDLWIKQAFWTVPLAWATVVHVGKRDAEVQVQFREDVLAANHGRVRCALCGDSGVLQADHVRPLWAKGANAAHNGQLLCVCCHRRKTGLESLARRIARRRAVWMTAGALLLLVLAKGWG
jgi:5-methylcytosine-specific restriction endonuclease McrA